MKKSKYHYGLFFVAILVLFLSCCQSIYAASPNIFIDNKATVIREAEDGLGEISDLGGGLYRVIIPVKYDREEELSLGMIGMDDSVDWQDTNGGLKFIYAGEGDNRFSIIVGNFSNKIYKSYAVRKKDNGDTLLFKGSAPELQAILRDASEKDGNKILVLKNICTKPIYISRIKNHVDNLVTLNILHQTQSTLVPVGGDYKIELRPKECLVKNQKSSDELSIIIRYRVADDAAEINSEIIMKFLCVGKKSIGDKLRLMADDPVIREKLPVVAVAVCVIGVIEAYKLIKKFLGRRDSGEEERRGGHGDPGGSDGPDDSDDDRRPPRTPPKNHHETKTVIDGADGYKAGADKDDGGSEDAEETDGEQEKERDGNNADLPPPCQDQPSYDDVVEVEEGPEEGFVVVERSDVIEQQGAEGRVRDMMEQAGDGMYNAAWWGMQILEVFGEALGPSTMGGHDIW